MAKEERSIQEINFFGGQDTDTSLNFIQKGDFIYGLNIVNSSSADGKVGVVTNTKGNLQITVPLPDGECETIGSVNDEERNRFVFFVWNSLGYHTIYLFNSVTRVVTTVMQSIADTGGVDVLNFSRDFRINMADINIDDIYWVDGGRNVARKLNIPMALDKTATGYGPVILPEYINAYKVGPTQSPVVVYFNDLTRITNTLYGSLRKFAYRFVYKDGSKSNYSDFSDVATPDKESFIGVSTIPTDNNGLHISVETGGREVSQIEVVMQTTIDTGLSSWLLVAVLDKKLLSITDNTLYVLNFYNDGKYGVVDSEEKIIRPYSFLPHKPKVQALVRGAMIYGNFKQGWENVHLNVASSVRYDPFVITTGVITKTNNPQFVIEAIEGSGNFIDSDELITDVNGIGHINNSPGFGFIRGNAFHAKIGADVKAGNTFSFNATNGAFEDTYNITYTATTTDTVYTVVTKLINLLIATTAVFRKAGDSQSYNINERITMGDGSIEFKFTIGARTDAGYMGITVSPVNPVTYETLNDTGQSIKNMKLGDLRQWGIVYRDEEKRISSTYTDQSMVVPIKSINELGNYKTPVVRFEISHQPPAWARSWQLAVTDSFIYNDFIQLLIQESIDVPFNGAGDYVDLVVGSLFTFQKIHNTTTLKYEFNKGDRLRLIRKPTGVYYDFFETEVLSYQDTVDDLIKENILIDGTDKVKVKLAIEDNVGKFISIDGTEREILAVDDPTHYTVNDVIGVAADPETFLSYHLIDRRGVIRIRKPIMEIDDLSMVEIYKPSISTNGVGLKQFHHLSPSYNILFPNTVARAHAAPYFNQEVATNQPGIIEISAGNVYIRNREQPITNQYPGTQTKIELVEDQSYSDFYNSKINDLGRINVQDTGEGEVNFGSRLRFSNNYIEDTKINGLNDFDNLDRKDYNDQFGDIVLLKYSDNRLLIFKELKDAWSPVYAKILQDKDGQEFVGTSSELLGDITYFAWDGGIGSHPESFASNGNMKYHVSVNSGIIARLGGDGVTPISETYSLDSEVRKLLREAGNYGAKIVGGIHRRTGSYIISIGATPGRAATTLSFSEKSKKFLTYSFVPDHMIKFKDEFFTFKAGGLWEHDVNPIRNNFYGVQYTSKIKFVANDQYQKNKMFFVMKIDSNGRWSVPSMITPKSETWPNGMKSMLHENNFDLDNGKYWADIMRDMNDPDYNDPLVALFEGRTMTGPILVCDIECKETKEVELNGVFIYSAEQDRNF